MKPRTDPFLAYVAVFHLAWVAWPFVVYPRLVAIDEATLTYALLNISLRLLLWVAPVVVYLCQVDHVDPVEYLRMSTNRRLGIKVALCATALNVAGSIVRFGVPHPTLESVTWNSVLGTSFLIGFIEEIPYRGFMLRKFTERLGSWPANLLTSLLFVCIHIPGWVALHVLTVERVVTIFVFAVTMSAFVWYSESLWASIVAHSANDCLSVIFFHR